MRAKSRLLPVRPFEHDPFAARASSDEEPAPVAFDMDRAEPASSSFALTEPVAGLATPVSEERSARRLPEALRPEFGVALTEWLARATLASSAFGLVELVASSFGLFAVASSGASLSMLGLASLRLAFVFLVPVCVISALVERLGFRLPRLPSDAWALAIGGGLISGGGFYALETALRGGSEEFPIVASHVRVLFVVLSVMMASLAGVSVARFARSRKRAFRISLALLCSMAAQAVAHCWLAPVYLRLLCAVAALAALGSAFIASWLAAPRVPVEVARVLAGLGAFIALTMPFPFAGNRAARLALYGHAPAAGALATLVRDAFDLDGDGSSPTWLGGEDCAELDAARGPAIKEIPGDGIDQDCRGGDALGSPPRIESGGPWPGCKSTAFPKNVLLLTIDALRYDAPSDFSTRNIARLARESTVFDRAYVASPLTTTSIASLFSGRTLSDLGDPNPITNRRIDPGQTLAERFRALGHRTAAFNYFTIHESLAHGFEDLNPAFLDLHPKGVKYQLVAAGMVNGIASYLARSDPRPFFVWAHIPDLHAPYLFEQSAGPEARNERTAYEAALRHIDRELGRLLAVLEHQHLSESTIVVLSADHGEQLGERLREGHGPLLFEEGVRVPLLVRVPGCAAKVIDEPVSLRALGATLGRMVGFPMAGRTLFPGANDGLPIVVEEAPTTGWGFKRAIYMGKHKLIVDVQNGGRMLFDLATDPGELFDIAESERAVADGLEAAYQRWLDAGMNR